MKTLGQAITAFIMHCRFEKNLNNKTIKAYRIDSGQFLKFTKEKTGGYAIESVDKSLLREYLQSISSLKPKTIKRKVATTKALFNFLEFEDKIHINPFRKMRIKIKEPKLLPNVMNLEEIGKIIQLAYKEKDEAKGLGGKQYFEKTRNAAILEVLFATGVRVSELTGITHEMTDLKNGVIKIQGKGSRERIVQVCDKTALCTIREYNSLIGQGQVCHMFVNRLGHKLSEQSVRFMVKDYAERAGIFRRITPHVFRHSFATLLLEQDVDIKYIQHFLGHSSIAITQIYTHVNKEKERQILSSLHPRQQIRI